MNNDKIKELRKLLRYTQVRFASKLGVSPGTISRWERGLSVISPLALKRIEKFKKDNKEKIEKMKKKLRQ